MYKNANDKYQAVSNYLSSNGIQANFYPQGSFRIGTVVRPLKDGKDADYDLDVIAELVDLKEKSIPKEVKSRIGDALKENKIYRDRLLPEDDRCWTLEYAMIDDTTGFLLDIVPSVHQDINSIDKLLELGVPKKFAEGAISITHKITDSTYKWQASNPKGYGLWFDNINSRFLEVGRRERRSAIFESNRNLYNSVDDVPEAIERSPLQRVIQILKRHRDLYYHRIGQRSKKPISAIITTLCAQIARHAPAQYSVSELLDFVAKDLILYSGLQEGIAPDHYLNYEQRSYISRKEEKWRIQNPVDPIDNYADSWDALTAKLFFQWVHTVQNDFINISMDNTDRYYAALKNGFGVEVVEKALPESVQRKAPVIITGTKPPKPWGYNERQ